MSEIVRSVPRASVETEEFWAATAEERFLIQRCAACGSAIFYPRATCPSCMSTDLGWEEASGEGTVHTFTIARRPTSRAFAEAGPYVIAIVELAEGPHVTTNVVDCDPEEVHIGQAVRVRFAEERDGIRLPLFAPVS